MNEDLKESIIPRIYGRKSYTTIYTKICNLADIGSAFMGLGSLDMLVCKAYINGLKIYSLDPMIKVMAPSKILNLFSWSNICDFDALNCHIKSNIYVQARAQMVILPPVHALSQTICNFWFVFRLLNMASWGSEVRLEPMWVRGEVRQHCTWESPINDCNCGTRSDRCCFCLHAYITLLDYVLERKSFRSNQQLFANLGSFTTAQPPPYPSTSIQRTIQPHAPLILVYLSARIASTSPADPTVLLLSSMGQTVCVGGRGGCKPLDLL